MRRRAEPQRVVPAAARIRSRVRVDPSASRADSGDVLPRARVPRAAGPRTASRFLPWRVAASAAETAAAVGGARAAGGAQARGPRRRRTRAASAECSWVFAVPRRPPTAWRQLMDAAARVGASDLARARHPDDRAPASRRWSACCATGSSVRWSCSALGGVLVEALDDVVFRVAPSTVAMRRRMIRRSARIGLFDAHARPARGGPGGPRGCFSSSVSELAADRAEVAELGPEPVIPLGARSAAIADARGAGLIVRRARAPGSPPPFSSPRPRFPDRALRAAPRRASCRAAMFAPPSLWTTTPGCGSVPVYGRVFWITLKISAAHRPRCACLLGYLRRVLPRLGAAADPSGVAPAA